MVTETRPTRQEILMRAAENADHLSSCCDPHCLAWEQLDENLFLLGYKNVENS